MSLKVRLQLCMAVVQVEPSVFTPNPKRRKELRLPSNSIPDLLDCFKLLLLRPMWEKIIRLRQISPILVAMDIDRMEKASKISTPSMANLS